MCGRLRGSGPGRGVRRALPHYADQAPGSVERRLKPAPLTVDEVLAAEIESYAPGQR